MSFRIDARGTIIMIVAMICVTIVLRKALGGTPYYLPAFFAALIIILAVGNWKWIRYQLRKGREGNDYFQ